MRKIEKLESETMNKQVRNPDKFNKRIILFHNKDYILVKDKINRKVPEIENEESEKRGTPPYSLNHSTDFAHIWPQYF